jgi:hypothetical protein
MASARVSAFAGSWNNDNTIFGLTRPGIVPFRPAYEKKLIALTQLAVAGKEVPGNEPRCIPNGLPMTMAFGLQIFVDATQMAVITGGPRVRFIWLDGREHTEDDFLFLSYDGESVARWDGDTLVVDTLGLKPTNEIVFGIPVDDEHTHIVERWRVLGPNQMQIETTIENAVALTKPWTYTRRYSRVAPSNDMQYCTAAIDRTRDGGFDLSPPAGGYIPPGAPGQ